MDTISVEGKELLLEVSHAVYGETFKLALVTGEYTYYINENESDENANTIMYDRNMILLSDNYFAYEALYENLLELAGRNQSPVYISITMQENFNEFKRVSNEEVEEWIKEDKKTREAN